MRIRQFGKGKYPYASEHNLAQDYIELNAKELAQDGKIIGICSSTGTLIADTDPYTVLIDNYVARTPQGERIYITSTALEVEPAIAVTSGMEVWVTVYAEYVYALSELDVTSSGVPYYKDYQNDYVFVVATGDLSSTGTAVKPTVSSTGVLLFDILYDNALYVSGILSDSDINTDRQFTYWHTHTNLAQLDLITDGLHETRTTNPHSVTKTQVGLGSVTNDAQIRKLASSTIGNIPTWNGTTGELLNNGYTAETILIGSSTGIPTAYALKVYSDDLVELYDVLIYKGNYSISIYSTFPAANSGHVYKIVGTGLLGNSSTGIGVTDGELIVCLADDTPEGTYSDVGQYWGFLQNKNEINVIGNGSSVANNVAVFSGSTGTIIIDSGYAAQVATTSQKGLVRLSDEYDGVSSELAITELALTLGLQTLSNVTNDAQLKREAGDFNTFSFIDPADLDTALILIEDSEDSYVKKTRQTQEIIFISTNAIHLTSSGEIDSLDEKINVVDDDILLIEDFDDSYSKKKVKVSNLMTSSGSINIVIFTNPGNTSTGLLSSTSTGDTGEIDITSSGLKNIFIYNNMNYLSSYPTNINTWSTSGNLNTARYILGGCGVQSASLSFGGATGTNSAVTEKFNGSTWASSGNLNTARQGLARAGIQSSALSFGGSTGSNSVVTEKFNGSSWTASGNLNTARNGLAGAGIQNSALSFGGTTGSISAITEKFNGSSWTASGDLNTARQVLSGAGTKNAALSFGGTSGGRVSTVEKFNGSTWISSTSLNTARYGLAGSGTQNAALSFGGYTTTYINTTEKFNGTSWETTNNLNTSRNYIAGSGTQNSALSFGGYTTTYVATTEKFNEPYKLKLYGTAIENSYGSTITKCLDISTHEFQCDFTIQCPANVSYGIVCEREFSSYTSTGLATSTGINIINYGSWNISGDLNTAVYANAGCGLQTATLSFNGSTAYSPNTYPTITEKFDGVTWTNISSSNITGRYALAGAGSQNAALSFGGMESTAVSETTEKFNGSTWSSTDSLNMERMAFAGSGIQNAALAFGGGNLGTYELDSTEEFNGSTWSYTGDMNVAKLYLGGCGIPNAALSIGGYISSTPTILKTCEKFNGVNWKICSDLNTTTSYISGAGRQNSAILTGCLDANGSITEKFNGSSWIVSSYLIISRGVTGGSGIQNAALSFGGLDLSTTTKTTTEKFNYNSDIAELFATEDYYVNKSNVVIEY